ncbi:TonB-dependent ferric acinetobactin receptor BauA [Acinetobacter baumannii]
MNQNIKGLSMNNVSYNRNFKTGNDQRINHRSFVLNGVASAQMALRLGYALGTVFVLCASNTYAAVIDNSAKTLEQQQAAQTNVATLPAITVKAEQDDTYAGGQVATSSNVGFLGSKKFLDTPFNTISYTDKYIEDKQAKDITEVIAATDPSIYTNGASGGWSENYYIRGYASSTNDMSMNGLFGITPFYRTSPEMFGRVEVLKGPSALLNGMPPAGSVGGTVNLVTKYAADEPFARLTTTYMSDAQFGGHVDVGRRFGENKEFGVRINGMYRDGDAAVNDQSKESRLFSLGLDWQGEKARVFVDAYDALDHVDGVTRGVNVSTAVGIPKPPKADTLLSPDWGSVETKDKGAMIRGEYDFSDQLMAYAAYGQSTTEYKYNGASAGTITSSTGTLSSTLGQLAFDVDKKSADAGFKGKFETGSVKHQWVANATYYNHTQDDYGYRIIPGFSDPVITNIYDPNPNWGPKPDFTPPFLFHSTLSTSSFGLADTLSFAQDKVQLTLGLRHQTVKATSSVNTLPENAKSATTPGVALLIKATDKISVYANYIEGLTKGDQAPATASNPGEIFPPQKTKQQELGLKVDLGTFAHTLSAFEITKPSSYLDPSKLVNNLPTFVSDGEQRNRGIEWSFFGSPIEHVRLMGGFTYLDPELTKTKSGGNDGHTAVAVPKNQAKLGAEWDTQVAQGTLTLSGNINAVSKQYINAENTLSVPGRTLLDVGARYSTKVEDHPVTFRANIYNLTNKAYWAQPQLTNLALGAPRTYMLSVSYDF